MPRDIFGSEESTITPKVFKEENGGSAEGFAFKIDELEKVETPASNSQQSQNQPSTTTPKNVSPKPTLKKPVTQKTGEQEEEIVEEKPSPDEAVNEFFKAEEVPSETKEEETKEEVEEGATDNQWEAYSKELYNLGVFISDADEEGNETQRIAKTPEEFRTLFEEQSNAKGAEWLDGFLTRFGEDRKNFFHSVFVNGVDPQKYFAISSQLESMKGLDLTKDVNQEKVVREFYRRNGLSQEKIDGTVQRLKDIAELQNQAESFHPALVQQDEEALLEENRQKESERQQEARTDVMYKNSISKIFNEKLKAKEFDGIPLTPAMAQKAFDYMYGKTWKTPDGKFLTDLDVWYQSLQRPENHALKVKLALLAVNNFDLSKVKQKAITQESNALFQSLKKKEIKANTKKSTEAEGSFNSVL